MKPVYLANYEENSSAHYGVGFNEDGILLQIDDRIDQARVRLTNEEAENVIEALKIAIKEREYNIWLGAHGGGI